MKTVRPPTADFSRGPLLIIFSATIGMAIGIVAGVLADLVLLLDHKPHAYEYLPSLMVNDLLNAGAVGGVIGGLAGAVIGPIVNAAPSLRTGLWIAAGLGSLVGMGVCALLMMWVESNAPLILAVGATIGCLSGLAGDYLLNLVVGRPPSPRKTPPR
jgi:hypothetical protein